MTRYFLRRSSGASLTELGLLVGLIAVLLIGSLTSVGQQLKTIFGATTNTLTNATDGLPIAAIGSGDPLPPEPEPEPEPDPTYASCQEWFNSTDSNFTNNGVNEIYPNGASTPINVYCQGAMTLILAQYEEDPVTNWNEGIQADYDPTLASKKGFALSTSEIPSHSKIYFGQNLASPAYCLTATYSTGNLGTTLHTECDTPTNRYYLYRNTANHSGWHNPDNGFGSSAVWDNTLSLELHQTSAGLDTDNSLNWAFSPMHTTVDRRGYSYLGNDYQAVDNKGTAWTVWVE